MKPKQITRLVVDLVMTALLLLQMAYMLTGQELHEWTGTGMLVLFVVHHALNAQWLKNLGKGAYTPFRVLQTILALLVLLAMLGLMVSGVMLSRHVFDFLPIPRRMAFARSLHLLAAYWGFILMSLHLGLHWGMITGMIRKAAKLPPPSPGRAATARVLAFGIAAYGIYAFVKHRIYDYLFLRGMFVFFDFEQPPAQFFLEYLAMMGLWVFAAYYLTRVIQKQMAAGRAAKTQKEEAL